MTAAMFKDWVMTCAIPEIEAYCKKQNLDNKALILVDNAPGHPVYVDEISEEVKFMFLPPNTTSVIQLMDQGVISTFKSYYLRRTFNMLINETDGDDKPTMQEFWKQFNIKKATDIISDSWQEITPICMNGVWRKIWPECIDKHNDVSFDDTPHVVQDMIATAKYHNFEGMDKADVEELLSSHANELTNDELMQMELDYACEEETYNTTPQEKQITTAHICKAISLIDEAIEI